MNDSDDSDVELLGEPDGGRQSSSSQSCAHSPKEPSTPIDPMAAAVRRWLDAIKRRVLRAWGKANHIPPVLLLMYFLHAWMLTFPSTAISGWLYKDLRLSNPQLNDFYSIEFLPYCFKPLYAYASDNYPIMGGHRRPYIRLFAALSAVCFVITGTCVSTASGAFAVTFFRTLGGAGMELLFGVILADYACRNTANAGAVQAAANGARNLGSIAAYAAGLAIFPPSGGQRLSNTKAIAVAAVFPACIFLLTFALPRSVLPPPARGDRGEVSVLPVLWFMPLFAWGQFSDGAFGLSPDVWWKVMVALAVIIIGVPIAAGLVRYGGARGLADAAASQPISFLIAAYALLFNAPPGDSSPVAVYQYDAFESNEYYIQYIGMVQFTVAFLACVLYSQALSGRSTAAVLFVCVILAGASKLAFLWFIQYHADHPADLTGQFGVLSAVLAIKQTGSELALVASLVLITQCTDAAMRPGVLYAIYLSFFDLGDVVSLQLSTQMGNAIVGKAAYSGVGPLSNSELARLVKVSAAVKAGSAVFVILVVLQRRLASRLDVRKGDDATGDGLSPKERALNQPLLYEDEADDSEL